MTDLIPEKGKPKADVSTKPEANPVGSATGRFARLQQAHTAALSASLSKEQQWQEVHDIDVDEAKILQSTPSVVGQSQPLFLEGSAQVPVVCDKASHSPELYDNLSHNLAGASPHAPHPPRRERRQNKFTKRSVLNIRMTSDLRSKLEAKADTLETYPSAHVLELIAADLNLPVDEHRATRNKQLKKAYADLRIAFDDCGVNLNQMAKATNSGKPCPLTRDEISEALRRFKKGCATLESLRPS